jgi:hypothetical protein
VPASASARKLAAIALPIALGAALLVILILEGLHSDGGALAKVTIGRRDVVYYSHAATATDADAMGHALKAIGFFADRGSSVLLSRATSGTILSFPVNEGAWDRRLTIASFEEIGRRVALVTGFPLVVRLCDSNWGVHKELMIGKLIVGTRDEIYYYGAATPQEALALGRELASAGYLVDRGASVVLAKNGATSISFVLGEGDWDRPGALTGFEALARKAAPSVGGGPIDLRLLNPRMEIEREVRDVR